MTTILKVKHCNIHASCHLANSLCMNQTLLSLNLGGNVVSDEGVKHNSDAISMFTFTHEQGL